MPFTVLQAGTALQMMDPNGVLSTLTLPTGIALNASRAPRFARFGGLLVMVNSPSRPITIDGEGTVRVLCPFPPRIKPTATGTGSGSLSGAYTFKQTFVLTDAKGNTLAESDYGPVSTSDTLSSELLKASGLDLSPDAVNGSRLYRTTAGGSTYFQWLDLDGNTQTAIVDGTPDTLLQLVAAPTLGTPPADLYLIAEFRGRLWGVSRDAVDEARYSEAGLGYAWPSDNVFVMDPRQADKQGVTGFLPMTDRLGVSRLNSLREIVGTGSEATTSGQIDMDNIIAANEVGCLSQETVQIFRDTAYFLWYDGVYRWNGDGIKNVALGKTTSWFTTSNDFNPERFDVAFAQIVDDRYYRLFMETPTGTIKWVDYDIVDNTWWGPHTTSGLSPTSSFVIQKDTGLLVPVVGDSGGDLYREQATRTDSTSTGIALDVIGRRDAFDDPSADTYFGQLELFGKVQAAGTLTVKSVVGEFSSTTTSVTHSADLTKSRNRLARQGVGKMCRLEFTHSTAGQDVELHGYDINPVHHVGRR